MTKGGALGWQVLTMKTVNKAQGVIKHTEKFLVWESIKIKMKNSLLESQQSV